jgi:hypothetical protein
MGDPTNQRLAEEVEEPITIEVETLEVTGAGVP